MYSVGASFISYVFFVCSFVKVLLTDFYWCLEIVMHRHSVLIF